MQRYFQGKGGGSGKEKPANSKHHLAVSLEIGTNILHDLVKSPGKLLETK